MLKIENTETFGWEAAFRGMRNAMNSWDKSDSWWSSAQENGTDECMYILGENDLKLAQSLVAAGSDHRKFLRMIHVQMDVTAPLYYFKELDVYKVGTVANSCSTMHKIHAKEFTPDDFSHEHLLGNWLSDWLKDEPESEADTDCYIEDSSGEAFLPFDLLIETIKMLNKARELFLETKDKKYWWNMIQLLPTSYNQRRTLDLNYEVLRNIYHARRNHRLDEWRTFCSWIETLPYAKELICS